jgi:hypothetical protein
LVIVALVRVAVVDPSVVMVPLVAVSVVAPTVPTVKVPLIPALVEFRVAAVIVVLALMDPVTLYAPDIAAPPVSGTYAPDTLFRTLVIAFWMAVVTYCTLVA